MVLESRVHGDSCFATLTYSPAALPGPGPFSGTLVPKHYQDWLKRLRERIFPRTVRYYLVGEYGEVNHRPHWHAILFGLGPEDHEVIDKSWGLGFTYVGTCTDHSIQYVAGYLVKRMTKKDDPRLGGRHPEFSRMSLKPGIGAPAMPAVTEVLTSEYGRALIKAEGDVPKALREGTKSRPLGRYLRNKLREGCGFKPDIFTESLTPRSATKAWTAEMLDVFRDLKSRPDYKKYQSLGQTLVDSNVQKVLNLEAKNRLYKKKETL